MLPEAVERLIVNLYDAHYYWIIYKERQKIRIYGEAINSMVEHEMPIIPLNKRHTTT